MLQALLANQLVVNTRVTHQDGMGVAYFDKKYNGFFIRGTTPPSKNDKLWQEYIEELDSVRYPVIAHVRRASTYTTDKQESHLHPFYDADTGIVLAHNGTLEFLDEERRKKTEEEFPNMIDSQVFFQILLEEFKKNGELKKDERIVKSLQDAMSQFYGKFAFLLRLGKTYYVIRGESASLYKATIYDGEDRVGFVINTELDSLKEGLYFTLTVFKAQ
jgi:predicted glutamine amidotransferase